MTDDKIAFRMLLENGSDATFLREMIRFASEIQKPGGRRHMRDACHP